MRFTDFFPGDPISKKMKALLYLISVLILMTKAMESATRITQDQRKAIAKDILDKKIPEFLSAPRRGENLSPFGFLQLQHRQERQEVACLVYAIFQHDWNLFKKICIPDKISAWHFFQLCKLAIQQGHKDFGLDIVALMPINDEMEAEIDELYLLSQCGDDVVLMLAARKSDKPMTLPPLITLNTSLEILGTFEGRMTVKGFDRVLGLLLSLKRTDALWRFLRRADVLSLVMQKPSPVFAHLEHIPRFQTVYQQFRALLMFRKEVLLDRDVIGILINYFIQVSLQS